MSHDEVAELVLLDLAAGPAFVEALQRVWEAGDAAFALDQRLPATEAARVVDIVRPTAVIDHTGERRSLEGGRALDAGDAIVVATSGTTGEPKAVIHTHDSVRASALATSAALGVTGDDTWLCCLPPAHVGGLSVILRALLTPADLVVHERFDAAAVDAAARDGATLVSVVTRALNQIDTTGFRQILIGGGPPPPDRADNVVATYGMTETGSGCVYDGYPLEGVELRIDDSNGTPGEIQIRADLLLRGYRTTAGFVDPRTDDGWFPTGDLGRLDPDGRLWVDGRAGDMLITGGENVWPHRVEKVLEAHPAIREAAVIGRPHPDWGQRVVAVLAADDPVPTLDEVREWVGRELPVWNAPKEIEFVEALPRTALGKIQRNRLG